MKRTATLFFTLILLLTGTAAALGQKRQLENTTWRLVEAGGTRVTRSAASISFDTDARSFSGNTGCNSMSGTVDIRGRNIDFGLVRTTKRMCKLMAGNVAESVVLNAIDKARTYEVHGDTLRLLDGRNRTLLAFDRDEQTTPESSSSHLDDRRWVLEQIKGRQTFVPLPRATLNFDEQKMSVGGDTGCNVFGGKYSTTRDQISIRDIISTMRACVESNKMSVERDMLDGLRSANRFEIKNDRLYLYRGREILLSFRGESKITR